MTPRAVIDFSDSFFGHPSYDFPALLISVLRCDKALMTHFLGAYNSAGTSDVLLTPKALLTLTLLNPSGGGFMIMAGHVPEVLSCSTWDKVETAVFGGICDEPLTGTISPTNPISGGGATRHGRESDAESVSSHMSELSELTLA